MLFIIFTGIAAVLDELSKKKKKFNFPNNAIRRVYQYSMKMHNNALKGQPLIGERDYQDNMEKVAHLLYQHSQHYQNAIQRIRAEVATTRMISRTFDKATETTYAHLLETETYGGEGFGNKAYYKNCKKCSRPLPVYRRCSMCAGDFYTKTVDDIFTRSMHCFMEQHQYDLYHQEFCHQHGGPSPFQWNQE